MSGFAYPSPIFNSGVYNPSFYLSLDPSGFLSYDYAQTLYLNKNDFRLTYITGITPSVASAGVAIVLDNDLSLTGLGAVSCDSLTVGGNSIISPPDYALDIIAGTAQPSKALVLNGSSDITGIGSISCQTLSVNGVAITYNLVGSTLTLNGSADMIVLNNSNPTQRSSILFDGDVAGSTREIGSRNSSAGTYANGFYLFCNGADRMRLSSSGSLYIQNNIECSVISTSGLIDCNSLIVDGIAITGIVSPNLTGTSLALTGNNNLILLTNTNAGGRSTIYFSGDASSSSWEVGSRNSSAGPHENHFYWFNQTQFRMVLRNNGSLWVQNGIECGSLTSSGQVASSSLDITGGNDMIVLNNSNAGGRSTIYFNADSATSRWYVGALGSTSGTHQNGFYWYNQGLYRMALRNNGSLYVQSNIECNGLTSTSQIDCPILNCTNYAIIGNTLDLGGQLTITLGDCSVRTGDVVLDDNCRLSFCRNASTKDLNSSIHCGGELSRLVLESTRGNGSVHIRTNVSSGTSPSVSFYDNSNNSDPIFSIFSGGELDWDDVKGPTDSKVFCHLNAITANRFIARGYASPSGGDYGATVPSFIWYHNGLSLGSSTPLCGLGPHDSVSGSHRTRFGFLTSTGLNFNTGIYNWSGGALSMYAGSWNTFSDIRLKSNIEASPYGLEQILRLTPVRYNIIDEADKKIGLIAQEVLEIMPELVSLSGDQNDDEENPVYLSMDYTMLGPVLIKAIEELSAIVETLTKRLDRIEARPVLKKWLEKNGS